MNESTFGLPSFNRTPIDLHSHFNHGSVYDCPERVIHTHSLAFIKRQYERVGVKEVGMSTFASVMTDAGVCEENDYLYELTQNTDWIYQWVVVDPRKKESYRQAEEMLSAKKTLGIKIHPEYHKYDVLEYADEIFSFAAARRAFVLMHPQHIPSMPAFADKYPDMKLIIAHLGSKEHVDAIVAAKNGNIFTDTSGIASARNNVLEYAVERAGTERIFFGTDTYSYAFQFGRIALSELSFEEKENILWKNALLHFGHCFE